ncbi:MAG: 4-(cytidine 5'-diphospho)-2-C-methyl-D-erythritol kinase [Acidobacteriota bacterium]
MMTRVAKLRSLAKINLDLRVLHRRADGFHELRTVFQTISLADTIEVSFEPARRTELHLDDALAIPDNLILRAAALVLDRMKVHARVRFRLKKNIPMGGGLGGGSSNAATVLLALPALAGHRVDLDTLSDLGSQLGSDIPFFLTGGTALGIDRGTELYPLPDIAADPLLIVCPQVHSSTAEAYKALSTSLTATSSSSKIRSFRVFVRTLGEVRSAVETGRLSGNDFQAVVASQHPELKALPGRLRRAGAQHALMTGSGSAFFAVFSSRAARDQALQGWRQNGRNAPAVAAEIVSQRRYQSLWRRQLRDHVTGEPAWPPQSRYGSKT